VLGQPFGKLAHHIDHAAQALARVGQRVFDLDRHFRVSTADGYLAGISRWGGDLGWFDLAQEYPHLFAHLEKLRADPAVAFAHAIEDGREVASSGRFPGAVPLGALAA
jgi:glutathione S-transferase